MRSYSPTSRNLPPLPRCTIDVSQPDPIITLFQASDWPPWLYRLGYIAACWFGVLLTALHSVFLCLHVNKITHVRVDLMSTGQSSITRVPATDMCLLAYWLWLTWIFLVNAALWTVVWLIVWSVYHQVFIKQKDKEISVIRWFCLLGPNHRDSVAH